MTRRARLVALQERNVNLALIRKRRGLNWAHLGKRQQAMYRAWLATFMGYGTDADLRSHGTDAVSPDKDVTTARTDARRGEE